MPMIRINGFIPPLPLYASSCEQGKLYLVLPFSQIQHTESLNMNGNEGHITEKLQNYLIILHTSSLASVAEITLKCKLELHNYTVTTSHKKNLLLILQPELPYLNSASMLISYPLPYQQI